MRHGVLLLTVAFSIVAFACSDDVQATPKCKTGEVSRCSCDGGVSGQQICEANGVFAACVCNSPGDSSTCLAGFTQSCPCEGGTGKKRCNPDGRTFGECVCGGETTCVPDSTSPCPCQGNMIGSKKCNPDGKSFSVCAC